MMMKKTILFFIFTLSLYAVCLAQNNQTQDTFTITTYYPAPHGVYGTMRIYPGQLPSEGVAPGVLYYNATEDMLKFHNNTTWVNMTGGGLWTQNGNNITTSGNVSVAGNISAGDVCNSAGTCLSQIGAFINAQPIAGNLHTRNQCTTAGGANIDIGAASPVCRFNATACPSGWYPFANWTTTVGNSCTCTGGPRAGNYCYCGPCSCGTGGHSWSDRVTETCAYTGTDSYGQCARCGGATCSASIIQIGCY